MIIAVDIRGSNEYQQFVYETFKIITAQHPDDTCLFIFDKAVDPSFIFSEKVIPVIVKQTKISLFHQLAISALLKKYQADVLVTSKTYNIKIPQCLVANSLTSSQSFKNAAIIISHSEFFKKKIINSYKIDPDKIAVVYKGVDEAFHSIESDERERVKDEYASGNEYFLAVETMRSTNNLKNLLKAFSSFKKWQKSSMQLLLTSPDENTLESLKSFKFKDEVITLNEYDKATLSKIISSAYAVVYPSSAHSVILSPLEVMRTGVPVITAADFTSAEFFGDSVLYCNSEDHNDIANKMMIIYKDEMFRGELIEKGKKQTKKYSWDNSANLLWQSILKAVDK